jgi:16S rRNA (guanine527-N7)-methyltransferase
VKTLLRYFPNLTPEQIEKFEALQPLYAEWNEKVNVISRKDIENLYERHVLHSLAIAQFMPFKAGSEVLDLGCGGGFPGIPLAIFFPEVSFLLVDSTAKKIRVVQEVAQALGLKNVEALHSRVEDLKKLQFDFVVTRAVAPTEQLYRWTQRLFKRAHKNILPNGIIALKGGDLKAEIAALPKGCYAETSPLTQIFNEPYFEEKCVVYIQA